MGILRRGALSLAALAGSVNASCVNFHPGPLTLPSDVMGTPPHLRWELRAGRAIAAPLGLDSASIYAAGMDRVVRAISIDTTLMWHKDKWLSPALAAFIGLVEERYPAHASSLARA